MLERLVSACEKALKELVKNFSKNIKGLSFSESADLTSYTTMRLHAEAPFLEAANEEALIEAVTFLNKNKIKFQLLGQGANQLISSNKDIIYLKLNFSFNKEEFTQKPLDEYILYADTPMQFLTTLGIKFGLKGFEVFTGVPASLGGAIFMNAGTSLGETGELVDWVKIIRKSGKVEKIKIDEKSFKYRGNNFLQPGDVILQACLKPKGIDSEVSKIIKSYLKKRNTTQPMSEWTCGCVFKNNSPEIRAGFHIDIVGLKGLEYKGLRISRKHANFIEHRGGATVEDFYKFVSIINEEIYQQTGESFQLEVQLPATLNRHN